MRASRADAEPVRLAATLAALMLAASPAAAQTGVSVAVRSQSVSRGHAVSKGYPTAEIEVSHDEASGLYAGAGVSGVLLSGGEPALLGFHSYLGYSRPIGNGLSLDVGVADTRYTGYSNYAAGSGYTEFYAGIAARNLSARVSLSPGYLRSDRTTVYGEINGVLPVGARWQLNAHVGMLGQLAGPATTRAYRAQYDWRLGAAAMRGPLRLELAVTGTEPDRDWYRYRSHARHHLVAGATYIF